MATVVTITTIILTLALVFRLRFRLAWECRLGFVGFVFILRVSLFFDSVSALELL